MLGEDEDWLYEMSIDMFPEDGSRSSPTNELPAAHRRWSNRPNSPARGARRMETLRLNPSHFHRDSDDGLDVDRGDHLHGGDGAAVYDGADRLDSFRGE